MPTRSFSGLTGRPVESTYLELAQSEYPGGLSHARHHHEPAYFTVVVAGGYDETVDGVTSRVESGTVIYHPAGEAHAVRFAAPQTRIFRVLARAGLHEAARLAGHRLETQPRRMPGAGPVLDRLHHEYLRGGTTAPLAIEALACDLITTLGSSSSDDRSNAMGAARVRDLLETRLDDPPSLAELGETAGCHPITLARQFRRAFGCSVGTYLRRRRLEEACRLLRESDQPISAVAARTGFADQAHLTRALRRAVGVTPALLRRAG